MENANNGRGEFNYEESWNEDEPAKVAPAEDKADDFVAPVISPVAQAAAESTKASNIEHSQAWKNVESEGSKPDSHEAQITATVAPEAAKPPEQKVSGTSADFKERFKAAMAAGEKQFTWTRPNGTQYQVAAKYLDPNSKPVAKPAATNQSTPAPSAYREEGNNYPAKAPTEPNKFGSTEPMPDGAWEQAKYIWQGKDYKKPLSKEDQAIKDKADNASRIAIVSGRGGK